MLYKLASNKWKRFASGTKGLCAMVLRGLVQTAKFKELRRRCSTCKLEVRASPLGGKGLFAGATFGSRRILVCAEKGTLYPSVAAVQANNTVDMPLHLNCKGKIGKGKHVVDGTLKFRDSLAYKVNHSCRPNATFVHYWITVRVRGSYHCVGVVIIQALRQIKMGEEIVVDYNHDAYASKKVPGTIRCACGKCGGKVLLYE